MSYQKYLVIYSKTNLLNVLMLMQDKNAHIAFISNSPKPNINTIPSIYQSMSNALVK